MSIHAHVRRFVALGSLATLALILPACASDGQLCILGYTTKPNYNTDIKTVSVPIFKNRTYYRGTEFDLTKEIIRKIEQQTPYKVVSPDQDPDTELSGEIVQIDKLVLLRNQNNTIREVRTTMLVKLVWRDLRTGEILSSPRVGPTAPPINQQINAPRILEPLPIPGSDAQAVPPLAGGVAPDASLDPRIPMIAIQSFGTYIPELGESLTTSLQENVKRMAVQITSMMEEGW